MTTAAKDLSGNSRRFILFTVFYNARAYYPVLAILFLDLGLTLDQFVLLNLIWAAAIFLFEVPSGALADTIGRKKLLVASSLLMVVEMACLLFAPRNGGIFLFSLCVLNRFLSGLSEAAASGADEALAYDSLPPENRPEVWDHILATAMKWRSVGFVIAMILGGLLYDPTPINRLLPPALHIAPEIAHRLPVALVLCQALFCLFITLRMVEPPRATDDIKQSFHSVMRLTLETARWVFTHPRTQVVVIFSLVIDSVCRNFATITSSYYRLIHLPEWTLGFIGSAIGVVGMFVPAIAKKLNARYGALPNLGYAGGMAILSLAALIPTWPYWGLLPAMGVMTVLGYLGFTVSRALHREADSSKRATVLSVKGLAYNLGYGLTSLGFSRLLASFHGQSEGSAMKQALLWQMPPFILLVIGLWIWAAKRWRAA